MIHITLPRIKPTIVMLLILKIGRIVNGANFDLSYLLGNSLNIDRSEILPTYVLRTGIGYGRFSYATAVGLVQSVVALEDRTPEEIIAMQGPVTSLTTQMATMLVATVPIICVYPFLQKFFVKGIMVGSLKG